MPENRIINNKILGDFGTNPPVEITISAHTNNSYYFNIRYTNINRKICFDFAEAASRTFTAVIVNGTGSSMLGNGTQVVKFPNESFNPTRAADLCDDNNSYIYLISE